MVNSATSPAAAFCASDSASMAASLVSFSLLCILFLILDCNLIVTIANDDCNGVADELIKDSKQCNDRKELQQK